MSRELPRTVGELGEDEIIRIFARQNAADARVLIPNGDDAAAFVMGAGEAAVVTTDTLVEGTHFRFDWSSPCSVGRKLAAVNLSDLAAMGAEPRYGFLSVCLDSSLPADDLRAIASGLHERADEAGLVLLGGNTTKIVGPNVFTLTLIGAAAPDRLISRGRSRSGEAIFVTGTLGDAKAGLMALSSLGRETAYQEHPELVAKQNEPTARVEFGRRLASLRRVCAMADVSDGLGRDLRRLLVPAGRGAVIEADRIPVSPALAAFSRKIGESALSLALSGGEDYELLFTAPLGAESELQAAASASGVLLTRIGVVSDEPEFRVRDREGRPALLPPGFAHFD